MAGVVPVAEQIKDSVKETLLGTEEPANVSSESKDRFLKFASIEENGEKFMSLEDFVDAIAPPDEDYVSTKHNAHAKQSLTPHLAQDRKSPIWHPVQRRR